MIISLILSGIMCVLIRWMTAFYSADACMLPCAWSMPSILLPGTLYLTRNRRKNPMENRHPKQRIAVMKESFRKEMAEMSYQDLCLMIFLVKIVTSLFALAALLLLLMTYP